ncbi:MAG: OmpA family protein [bacterium]|nr:OmpA family protein [bacterium]
MNKISNKLSLGLLTAGLLVSSMTSLATAEGFKKGQMEVGTQIGGMLIEGDSKVDAPHIAAGARFGYFVSDQTAVEAGILSSELDVKNNDESSDMLLPTVEAQYHLPVTGSIVPFVAAGLGAIAEDGPSPANTGSVVLPVGGGLKWLISKDLLVRTDARWIVDTDGGNESHKGSYTAGVSWLFGGPRTCHKAVEPVAEPVVMPEAAAALERDNQVSINLEVQFDFDKVAIKPQFEARLQEFAAFMKQHPETNAEIEGHTDNIGSKTYNDKLSMRRANSVKAYLISKGGIDSSRLRASGYGFSRPVATNATDAGRAQNRRVIGTVRK